MQAWGRPGLMTRSDPEAAETAKTTMVSVVTGAFGYTGKYITRRLLDAGHRVRTLTGHPERPDPFGERVEVAALDFNDPGGLSRSLEGADALYNTYWVRFPRGRTTFDSAVENSETLFRAAKEAGVRRIVHISITGASPGSNLPYFRGKGQVEEALIGSGLSYTIVRPTLIFGREDLLVNNIAWFMRRLPVFGIFGSGDYAVQPVFVRDVARIAVEAAGRGENEIIDAVGPETYTFEGMVRLIAGTIGSKTGLVHLSPRLAFVATRALGYLVGDVVVTRDEIDGLMAGLLVGRGGRPTGEVTLRQWLAKNANELGRTYRSELRLHY